MGFLGFVGFFASTMSEDDCVQHASDADDDAPEEVSFTQGKTDAFKLEAAKKEVASKQPKRKRKPRNRNKQDFNTTTSIVPDVVAQVIPGITESSEDEEEPTVSDVLSKQGRKTKIGRRVIDLKRRTLEVTTTDKSVKIANRLYYDNPNPTLPVNFKASFLNDPKRVKRLKPPQPLT